MGDREEKAFPDFRARKVIPGLADQARKVIPDRLALMVLMGSRGSRVTEEHQVSSCQLL